MDGFALLYKEFRETMKKTCNGVKIMQLCMDLEGVNIHAKFQQSDM